MLARMAARSAATPRRCDRSTALHWRSELLEPPVTNGRTIGPAGSTISIVEPVAAGKPLSSPTPWCRGADGRQFFPQYVFWEEMSQTADPYRSNVRRRRKSATLFLQSVKNKKRGSALWRRSTRLNRTVNASRSSPDSPSEGRSTSMSGSSG